MSINDIGVIVKTLREAGIDEELIQQIAYAVDYEKTVSALEARLRGGYKFEEIIGEALGTTMDFYDADSALVINIDMDLMMAKPEFEIHREGFMPVCGTKPMYLNEYPAILEGVKELAQSGRIFPYTEILPLLMHDKKTYNRILHLGIHSIMAVPYHKRNIGFVLIINPRRYKDYSSLLQVLSYVTVAEINEMNLMNYGKRKIFNDRDLADNEVYVKFLNGFELHTKEGVVTERDIRRKQGVLLLTLLLWQNGKAITGDALMHLLWDDPDTLEEPERALKNLSYNVKKSIIHLFPANGFLEIKKSGYSISRRYSVKTDLDCFIYKIRDAEGTINPSSKLEKYLKELDDFSGIVLPEHDHRAIGHIVEAYENRRKAVQDSCLELMYELGKYNQMREFIGTISAARNNDGQLSYWNIKSNIALKRIELAKKQMSECHDILTGEQINELQHLTGVV